jgi:SAM-dependent methyltransferase
VTRQHSPAFERNRGPIADVLQEVLGVGSRVLEVGSGSGQHAAWFAGRFPGVHWMPSDVPGNLVGIDAWVAEAGVDNVDPARPLDLLAPHWPEAIFDTVMALNVVHIVRWSGVEALFRESGRRLPDGGLLFLYGPFRYPDRQFEPSNRRFDAWLRERDPESGVRDFPALDRLARDAGMMLEGDREMAANNRALWWRRQAWAGAAD